MADGINPIGNLRGKVDSNNALVVSVAAGSDVPAPQTISADNIGTTSTDGLVLENGTDAAAGAQQYSPRMRLHGEGWKTDATAGSQTVDFALEVQPVQGTSAPTGNLVVARSINGGAYSTVGTFASNGGFTASGSLTHGGSIIHSTTGNGILLHVSGATARIVSASSANTYDIALADWGTTLSAEGVSVADAGTLNLGAARLGELKITVGTDNIVGTFQLRGSANAVVAGSDNDALFTTTKDNAATINVYFDTNAYFIQNNRGGARTVRAVLIGA